MPRWADESGDTVNPNQLDEVLIETQFLGQEYLRICHQVSSRVCMGLRKIRTTPVSGETRHARALNDSRRTRRTNQNCISTNEWTWNQLRSTTNHFRASVIIVRSEHTVNASWRHAVERSKISSTRKAGDPTVLASIDWSNLVRILIDTGPQVWNRVTCLPSYVVAGCQK